MRERQTGSLTNVFLRDLGVPFDCRDGFCRLDQRDVCTMAIDAERDRDLGSQQQNVIRDRDLREQLHRTLDAADFFLLLILPCIEERLRIRFISQTAFDDFSSLFRILFANDLDGKSETVKKLRTDLPLGHLLQRLLAGNIAVYAAHTNLDIAEGGVNDVLAERIGCVDLEPFDITEQEELIKLAVYVPADYEENVRMAITKAGAGCIGRYSCCTFRVQGKGTFLPLEGTNPFIGQQDRLETVDEVRIETILPARMESRVVKAMLKAHPYEEAAYDLYPLKNRGRLESLGRIGHLPQPLTPEAFAERVRDGLGAEYVRLVKAGDKHIEKVALCSGSGAEFIAKAAFMGADAYVTGDVKYHDAQRAVEAGMHVIDAGHFPTEFPIVAHLADRLRAELKEVRCTSVPVLADQAARDFFTVIR